MIERTIRLQSGRVLLVAHSFGCLAVAALPGRLSPRITGALLVAPCDTQRFDIDERLADAELPFPSTLVASRNDPWMSYTRAEIWAARWGSRLEDAGHRGHIIVASGHGAWPGALPLIAELSGGPSALVFQRRESLRDSRAMHMDRTSSLL